MKYRKIFVATALLAITIVSCEKDNVTINFSGIADIYVRCIKSGDSILYAPVMYARSNMHLKKVNAFEPDATEPTYQLTEYFNGNHIFRRIPDRDEFSTTDVVNGVYSFDLISTNGDSINIDTKIKDILLGDPQNFFYCY